MSTVLIPLSPFTAPAFLPLVATAVRSWIDRIDDASVVGFGATDGSDVVGVGVATVTADGKGHLLWLYVAKASRRQGTGRALLTALEQAILARGAISLVLQYALGPRHQVLEQFLGRCGWATRQANMMRLTLSTETSKAPWFNPEVDRRHFELTRWADTTEREKERVNVSYRHLPVHFQPRVVGTELDTLTSLALRHRDRIVGWHITHRVGVKDLSYTSLFVDDEFRGTGVGFALGAEVVRRQVEAYGQPSLGYAVISTRNLPMVRIAELHLSAYVLARIEMSVARKGLA